MPESAIHAIASSTSERAPTMCDGSNFSDSRGGIRKPVALVKIVNSRNVAVSPGIDLEVRSPNMTMMPATMPIRLMMTCTVTNVDRLIPRIMTRSPFWSGECYDYGLKIATCVQCTAAILAWATIKNAIAMAKFFAWPSQPRRHCCRILAIEKFDQFRDDLVRRLFHQPVAPAFYQYDLDIGRYHFAQLDQEGAAGFFA